MRVFKNTIWLPAALLFAAAPGALATPCGTVASPTGCTITVGGQVTYDFTGFNFVSAGQAGGGNLYQGGDIDIDVATGGGLTALITFTKHSGSPTPGIVFLANPGDVSSFTFQYNLGITPAAAGTVAFVNPLVNSFNETHTNNALASIQVSIPSMAVCQAFTGTTSVNCNLPGSPGTSLVVGDIVSLSGNGGNTGITQFQTLFSASFTPSGAEVPEPATTALIGAGLIGIFLIRRRKIQRRVMEHRRTIERLSA